jgi:hypothetical protein
MDFSGNLVEVVQRVNVQLENDKEILKTKITSLSRQLRTGNAANRKLEENNNSLKTKVIDLASDIKKNKADFKKKEQGWKSLYDETCTAYEQNQALVSRLKQATGSLKLEAQRSRTALEIVIAEQKYIKKF